MSKAERKAEEQSTRVRAKRILVVDEDALMCHFYRHILTAQGYRVVSATTRKGALKLIHDPAEEYALYVLDINYPDGEGWLLLSELRKASRVPEVPVIAITDFSDSIKVYGEIKQFSDAMVLKGEFEIPQFNELVHWIVSRQQVGCGADTAQMPS